MPVLWTRELSVRPTTLVSFASALACLAGSLTTRPWMNGTWPVTLPPWALTTCLAAFSLNVGLNWTIASTVRFGVFDAAVASFACALGAAWATGPAAANGTIAATIATLSRPRFFLGNMSGHLLVPLPKQLIWNVGGRAISLRGDLWLCVPASRRVCLYQPC